MNDVVGRREVQAEAARLEADGRVRHGQAEARGEAYMCMDASAWRRQPF